MGVDLLNGMPGANHPQPSCAGLVSHAAEFLRASDHEIFDDATVGFAVTALAACPRAAQVKLVSRSIWNIQACSPVLGAHLAVEADLAQKLSCELQLLGQCL